MIAGGIDLSNLRQLYHAKRRLVHLCLRSGDAMARKLWAKNPLVNSPVVARETYLEIFARAQTYHYPSVDQLEREVGIALDRDFMNNLALHTQVVVKSSPMMWAHGRILYALLTDYLKRSPPSSPIDRITILETGTARGYSSLCMAKALYDAKRPGVIFTADVVPHDHPMYWNCIDDMEGQKTRRQLLEPWNYLVEPYVVFCWGDSQLTLKTLAPSRVHFAFLDGGHTYDDVMLEFSRVGPFQKPGDIIVFDDVTPASFPAVAKAVAEICSGHSYDRRDIQTHANRVHAICRKL
jgi:predicted O-methyltransferase YrrM